MSEPIIPRCGHGHIILGCPHDDCPEQNAYVDEQRAAMDAWHAARQADARALVRAALRDLGADDA